MRCNPSPRTARIARIARIACIAALALVFAPAAARSQEHQHGAPAVGSAHFPVACNATAQVRMHTAVAMLHSFWFPEARRALEAVAAADPGCGIAWWGIALTHFGNPLAGSGPEAQARAAAAAARAVSIGARDARDSAYIAAVSTLVRDHATVPVRQRMLAYEDALQAIVAAYPDDDEAKIFHALAIVANAPPTDRTYARQHAAAQVLTALYARMPQHPGLAHYLIHAFDAPSLAHHALDAARQYAAIAPDAPHALHMPSHTFTRLGYWDESIATNRRSADAEPIRGAKAHPMDYLVYAYLQQGREDAARAVVEELGATDEQDYLAGTLGSYNGRAMRARLALELDDWEAAMSLPAPDDPPSIAAISHFTRALGAARAGDLAGAQTANAVLDSTVARLAAAGDAYWAHTVGAQHRAVSAWIAHLEGRHADALRLAAGAAEAEDEMEKHPVTPGPLIPARELYADILALHGQHAQALAQYEAVMTKEPNRLRTLHGAARAALAAGDRDAAARHYKAISALVHPESTHPAAAAAVAFARGAARG
ncbi:MAG: hypothetical protein H0X64_01785 [Gemmatimonadaceae bacterium]|nr:hypothetical protein [Gemmatimonadaceae bacterium]